VGQNTPAPELQKGFTGFEGNFRAPLNSDSKTFQTDSNAGYDFNKAFGIFAGMRSTLQHADHHHAGVNGTATTTTTNVTNNGLGNAYFGFCHARSNKTLGTIVRPLHLLRPTGDLKGFSSGRAMLTGPILEHSFDRLTPFSKAVWPMPCPIQGFCPPRPFTSLAC